MNTPSSRAQSAAPAQSPNQPESGFSYTREFFAGLVDHALAHAQ